MLKNKKLIITNTIFTSCLCISCMAAGYVFIKNNSKSMSGKTNVEYRDYDCLTLKAGYSDHSCIVQDNDGNELEKHSTYVYSFFMSQPDVYDEYGNHFAKLKKYYVNMSQDDSGVITYKLSHFKINSTYFVCPYFKDLDGNEVDYAYYGKYKGCCEYVSENATSVLHSKKGLTPTYGKGISNFRYSAYLNAKTYNYCITDWCAMFTLRIMFMCYYKTTYTDDSNLGARSSSYPTGSGPKLFGAIEDVYGNGYEFIDGIQLRADSNGNVKVYWADTVRQGAYNYASDSGITTNETDISSYVAGKSGQCVKSMICVNGSPALNLFPKETFIRLAQTGICYYSDRFDYSSDDNNTIRAIYYGISGNYISILEGFFHLSCTMDYEGASDVVGTRLYAKKLNKEYVAS